MNIIKNVAPYVAIIVLFFLLLSTCDKGKKNEQLYNSSQDSLRIGRNKENQQKASIELLQSTNKNQFLSLQSNDSTIKKLQSIVKKQDGQIISATILGNNTSFNSTVVNNVSKIDTIRKDSFIYLYPEYKDTIKNKWYIVGVKVGKDSSKVNVKVFNEFELSQSLIKQKGIFKFLKPSIPTASILNLNPYTVTTEFRTFTISCECHNSRWFTLGTATGAAGIIAINKFLLKK